MSPIFRNLYRTSNIYIGCPIYISDVRYLYPTSNIPALALALALALAEVGYCISDIGYRYRTSNIYIECPIQILDVGYRYPDVGYRYPDVRYRYPVSDIDIGCRIYILDVRYRFQKHWWHFVLNGACIITSSGTQQINFMEKCGVKAGISCRFILY